MTDQYVDRAPAKSPAMRAAYEALAAAEAVVAKAHAAEDWPAHRLAIKGLIAAHAEIGRIAQARK